MTERIRINRIELGQTLAGKPVVHLHAPGAQYSRFPVLYLFDPGLLIQAGIDPNRLGEDPIHCNLWAHFEFGEKLNSQGNPYKNVVSLEAIDAPATTTSVDTSAILGELRAIKALLLELTTGPSTELKTSSQPPAAPDQATRVHAIMQAGRGDPPAEPQATEPQTTEPEPETELSEAEARTAFYELTGPAITAGTDPGAVNDLTALANGDGWNTALAGLKALLAS